jgi:flagellar FliJ protein
MSAFRFRLETLLRLRLADRDQRRADLVKAQRAENALLDQAEALAQEQGANQELSRQWASPGAADVDRLIASHRYELVLRTRSQQLAAQIQQVRGEVERRRQALVEADRQVRVLEKLRERQQLAHHMREEKREQKQLDERAILGFLRRRRRAD